MAVNMDKLNVFAATFIGDLGAAGHSAMLVIGAKLGLYKALAEGPPELSRVATTGRDVARCMGTDSDTKTSENRVTGWRKRHELFVRRQRAIAAAVLSGVLLAPSRSYSECTPNDGDRVELELSALGKQGDTIARARGQVFEILQNGNACTAWFQESDPDPADVFRSLHFELDESGPRRIYNLRNSVGEHLFKHPWAAKSYENSGRKSTVLLNANGPFFQSTSLLMEVDLGGLLARPVGQRLLRVASYEGNTPEAQITILLHELGHIIGRLPEDDDSLDGRSSRNTAEVQRHCKTETRAAARNSPRGSIRATISAFNPATKTVKRATNAPGNRFLSLTQGAASL
jgi:hypothetical protein